MRKFVQSGRLEEALCSAAVTHTARSDCGVTAPVNVPIRLRLNKINENNLKAEFDKDLRRKRQAGMCVCNVVTWLDVSASTAIRNRTAENYLTSACEYFAE